MRPQNEGEGEVYALSVRREKNVPSRPRWEGHLFWPAAKIERYQKPLICLGSLVAQHIFINRDGAICSMPECGAGTAQSNQLAIQRQAWNLGLVFPMATLICG